MKAILVIDIPDDFKFKKSYADITLVDGKHNMWKRITEVKPMPEKKEIKKCNTWQEMFRAEAFNEIIDEIQEPLWKY